MEGPSDQQSNVLAFIPAVFPAKLSSNKQSVSLAYYFSAAITSAILSSVEQSNINFFHDIKEFCEF
jgi:hypothetical protein